MFSRVFRRNTSVHTYAVPVEHPVNLWYREPVMPTLRYSPAVAKGNNQEMRRQKFQPNTADLSWKVKVIVKVGTCPQDFLPT